MNKKTYKLITKIDSIPMPDLWYVSWTAKFSCPYMFVVFIAFIFLSLGSLGGYEQCFFAS